MTTINPKVRVMIPARLESSRLPGKVLMDIQGKTMIHRVYDKATRLFLAEDVYIATDSEEILKTAESFGANVVMTSSFHQSGTQRLAEAVKSFNWPDEDIVVNLQGDEPEISETLIRLVAHNLATRPSADVSTLYVPIQSEEEFLNPNVVKVVTDDYDNALYFSREPIPHHGFREGIAKRHIGIYCYRVGTLKRISSVGHPKLEFAERLEQLQVLCQGGTIYVGEAPFRAPPGIDTQEDLSRARSVRYSD
jgi:3-deoxy-manno-octulosonate cytidylyltransferase (CMP-KDO synthetase)